MKNEKKTDKQRSSQGVFSWTDALRFFRQTHIACETSNRMIPSWMRGGGETEFATIVFHNKHILALDVAMHHLFCVQRCQSCANISHDAENFLDHERWGERKVGRKGL